MKIYQNEFGIYYIGDKKGNPIYKNKKIMASEDKEKLEKIMENIKNGK